MQPHDVLLFGWSFSIWNALFLAGVLLGYPVLLVASSRGGFSIHRLALRYLVTVYLSALAAQLFAYAFDANTSLSPPPGRGWAGYYLDPMAGPKTLYGVFVLLPITLGFAGWRSGVPLRRLLDLWSAPLLVVLATSRVGCFLQGCCHGIRSEAFGLSFPPGAPVYYEQLRAGLIAEGSRSLPVLPTQLLEAILLASLAGWTLARRCREGTFVVVIAVYSVFRFAIEFARADVERGLYGPLATSQWIALLVLAVVAAVVTRRRVSIA